eukprot:IDg12957t1
MLQWHPSSSLWNSPLPSLLCTPQERISAEGYVNTTARTPCTPPPDLIQRLSPLYLSTRDTTVPCIPRLPPRTTSPKRPIAEVALTVHAVHALVDKVRLDAERVEANSSIMRINAPIDQATRPARTSRQILDGANHCIQKTVFQRQKRRKTASYKTTKCAPCGITYPTVVQGIHRLRNDALPWLILSSPTYPPGAALAEPHPPRSTLLVVCVLQSRTSLVALPSAPETPLHAVLH